MVRTLADLDAFATVETARTEDNRVRLITQIGVEAAGIDDDNDILNAVVTPPPVNENVSINWLTGASTFSEVNYTTLADAITATKITSTLPLRINEKGLIHESFSRTNLALQSSNPSVTAVWVTSTGFGTIVDNTSTAYNFSGTPRQLTIIPESGVNGTPSIRQIMLSATVGQIFRASWIFKRRTGKTNRDATLTATDPGHNTIAFWYLNSATFASTAATGGTKIISDQRLEDMGGGRFRCSCIVKPLTAGNLSLFYRGVPLSSVSPLVAWTGTTADGFEFGSVMFEQVAADTDLASWPIHTTTATVTSAAEDAAIFLAAGHTYTITHTYDNATTSVLTAVPSGTYAMPSTPSGRAIVTTAAVAS